MTLRKIIVLFASVLLLFAVLSASTVSAQVPVWAIGEVVDGDRLAIEGADVSATCNDVTLTTSTNSYGKYAVDFTGICSATDNVVVTASYQGASAIESGAIEDYTRIQIAEINIILHVPEFATIAIPAVAILGLFLFFNHRKRREE